MVKSLFYLTLEIKKVHSQLLSVKEIQMLRFQKSRLSFVT